MEDCVYEGVSKLISDSKAPSTWKDVFVLDVSGLTQVVAGFCDVKPVSFSPLPAAFGIEKTRIKLQGSNKLNQGKLASESNGSASLTRND